MVHRMETEWDPAKARANLHKHGVRFADAVIALEDPRAISVRDEMDREERWITMLISARTATRREARRSEEGI